MPFPPKVTIVEEMLFKIVSCRRFIILPDLHDKKKKTANNVCKMFVNNSLDITLTDIILIIFLSHSTTFKFQMFKKANI